MSNRSPRTRPFTCRLAPLTVAAGCWAALPGCSEPKAAPSREAPPSAVTPQPASASPAQPAAVAPGVGGAAAPAPSRPISERLTEVFGGYEYVPHREDLLSIAPEAELVPALWALYQTPGQRLIVRTQALVSLRFFPSGQVKSWYEQVLGDAKTVDAVRRPLVKAYGFAFGEQAVDALGSLLGHADLYTRDAAARALGAIGTQSARNLLTARAKVESEPSVRSTIDAQLAQPARPVGGK